MAHGLTMWDLLRLGIKPTSPELGDRFFTTEPPGKPLPRLSCGTLATTANSNQHMLFVSLHLEPQVYSVYFMLPSYCRCQFYQMFYHKITQVVIFLGSKNNFLASHSLAATHLKFLLKQHPNFSTKHYINLLRLNYARVTNNTVSPWLTKTKFYPLLTFMNNVVQLISAPHTLHLGTKAGRASRMWDVVKSEAEKK